MKWSTKNLWHVPSHVLTRGSTAKKLTTFPFILNSLLTNSENFSIIIYHFYISFNNIFKISNTCKKCSETYCSLSEHPSSFFLDVKFYETQWISWSLNWTKHFETFIGCGKQENENNAWKAFTITHNGSSYIIDISFCSSNS